MHIQINLEPSDLDDANVRKVLLALAGQGSSAQVEAVKETAKQATVKPAAKPAAKPEAKPEVKPEAKPEAKPASKKPAVAVEEAAPEATPENAPTPEATEPSAEEAAGATPKDAISRATKLVSAGKTARVKAVLSELGAKKVSDLKGKKIAEFIQLTEEDVAA